MKTEMCYIYTLLEVIKFVSSLLNVILVISNPLVKLHLLYVATKGGGGKGGVLSPKTEMSIKSYENNNT